MGKKNKLKRSHDDDCENDVVKDSTIVDNNNNEEVNKDIISELQDQKKDKKKKKKKHKQNDDNDNDNLMVDPTTTTDDLVENQEKSQKKKKKKEKKQEDVIESTTSSTHQVFTGGYVAHQDVTAMTLESIQQKRTELAMQVYPASAADLYHPLSSFEQLAPSLKHHCSEILAYIHAKKFSIPSPIQSQCWPPLLDGKDVIGIAATGSGKTLAFLVPALLKLAKLGPNLMMNLQKRPGIVPSPRVLVVAPTRELAMQSYQVFADVGGPKSLCIYGGVGKFEQIKELKAGADIVVATPGRLMDLLQENHLSLQHIALLVLDEADRMLDDGFEPAIKEIVRNCPDKTIRQTVMFSATWPEEIRTLADRYLKSDVIRVTVGSEELSANHRVTQIVECIESFGKDKKLLSLLEKYHSSRKNRVLIFVLYKKEAVELQTKIQNKGYNVTAIHGDKNQHDRTSALEEFKSGRTPLLIATDVAARGLDIPQVEYVINYSFPLTVEDYVHRIGRTGRGGATGISHTFFTDFDKSLAGALVGVLQEANQEVPQEIFKYPMVTKKKQSNLYGAFGPKTELSGQKATKITFDD